MDAAAAAAAWSLSSRLQMSAGDLPVATSASSYQQLKSMLTLDLTSESPPKKRRTVPFEIDYEKLQSQIISPLIASLQTVATPTPSKIFGPQDVSQAQAQYAQGFLDALNHVQRLNNFIPNNMPSPSLLNPALLNFSTTPTLPTNPIVPTTTCPPTTSAIKTIDASSVSSSSKTTTTTSTAPKTTASAVTLPLTKASTTVNTKASTSEIPPVPPPAPAIPTISALPPTSPTTLPTSALPASTSSCSANDIVRYIELINMQNPHHHQDSAGIMPPFFFPPVVPSSSSNAMMSNSKALPPGMPNPNMLSPQLPQLFNQIQQRDCDMPSSSGASLGMNSMFPGMAAPLPPPSSMDDGSMDGAASCSSSRSQEDLSFMNGVDLDDQERKKLERKRARNRLAATKCRQRKLEKIQELENLVSHERTRGANLLQDIENLRKSISSLENELKHHQNQGCNIVSHKP